jgi:hypothetical protein
MSNRGSINVNISPALNRLKKFREQLDKREMTRGISMAINEALREGRKKAIERVTITHNIPRNYLTADHMIVVESATPSKLAGTIMSDTSPLPLGLFDPKSNPGSNTGVSFKVLKSSRGKIGYAFMIPGSSHVYGRGNYLGSSPYGFIRNKGKEKTDSRSKKREKNSKRGTAHNPVTKLVTVSVNGAINGTRNKVIIENFIERNLPKKLRTELQRRLDKLQK